MRTGLLEDLELALGIINEVDSYTLQHFSSADYKVFEKADLTPVTEIDRNAEKIIRDYLYSHRPCDLIYGEEYGSLVSSPSSLQSQEKPLVKKTGSESDKKYSASFSVMDEFHFSGGNADFPAPSYGGETEENYFSDLSIPDGDNYLENDLEEVGNRRPGRPRKDSRVNASEQPKRCWIIDPIDGTKNFVRGVPVWASLLALSIDEEIVLGVVSAPALKRRWWAGRGLGAWTQFDNQEPVALQVSSVRTPEEMSISYSSLSGWKKQGKLPNFLELLEQATRTRAYGDFWSYMLVAEGVVDVALEPELELYDMAALVPIVEEAGGVFTSLNGKPGCWGGNALATNGKLHDYCLKMLNR